MRLNEWAVYPKSMADVVPSSESPNAYIKIRPPHNAYETAGHSTNWEL